MVRGVGPRVPRDHARPRRPGVREVPAARHVPGVVPAPQRRAARVRVVVRRRQPAGPRPGAARGLEHRRAARHASSWSGSSTSCCSTSRGGSTARMPRATTCSRGGFLGLDNLCAFDRSHLPVPGTLEQSDATAWMYAYCMSMLAMARARASAIPPTATCMTTFLERAVRIAPPLNQERPVGRRRRLLLRPAALPDGPRCRCGSTRWSACCRSCRRSVAAPGDGARAPRSASTSRASSRRRHDRRRAPRPRLARRRAGRAVDDPQPPATGAA